MKYNICMDGQEDKEMQSIIPGDTGPQRVGNSPPLVYCLEYVFENLELYMVVHGQTFFRFDVAKHPCRVSPLRKAL